METLANLKPGQARCQTDVTPREPRGHAEDGKGHRGTMRNVPNPSESHEPTSAPQEFLMGISLLETTGKPGKTAQQEPVLN